MDTTDKKRHDDNDDVNMNATADASAAVVDDAPSSDNNDKGKANMNDACAVHLIISSPAGITYGSSEHC